MCDRNTLLLEVGLLWCGLMATLEDDQAELENLKTILSGNGSW